MGNKTRRTRITDTPKGDVELSSKLDHAEFASLGSSPGIDVRGSYPKVNKFPSIDFVREYMTQYYDAQDLKLLKDLIIQIMAKGYYPIIKTNDIAPTIERTEHHIKVSQPLDQELVLLTKEELFDIGIDFIEYTEQTCKNLDDFRHSPTKARKKNE